MKKQIQSNRSEKIAVTVQTHVAKILSDQYSEDKYISLINLVGAEARRGLQFVKLFYYARYENELVFNKIQKRLDDIKNMVRYELAQRMNQKYVPDLKFVYDDTLESAERIEKLLENL